MQPTKHTRGTRFSPRFQPRPLLTGVLASLAWASFSACSLPGCSGRTPPPSISSNPYQGPPLSLEVGGGVHVIVAQSPSPGFVYKLDRIDEGHGYQGAFITIQQPNPAFSYASVIVEQRLATGVPRTQPVRVFARIVDFQGRSSTGDAYSPVPMPADLAP
ncbi:MAG: hypothetical protein KF859_08845 [Phycisphaeraceae bacterium]|nr:hypothetical protein [Phycisphaeraceae bacterium]